MPSKTRRRYPVNIVCPTCDLLAALALRFEAMGVAQQQLVCSVVAIRSLLCWEEVFAREATEEPFLLNLNWTAMESLRFEGVEPL